MPQLQFVFTVDEVKTMKQALIELESANSNEFSLDLTADQEALLENIEQLLRSV